MSEAVSDRANDGTQAVIERLREDDFFTYFPLSPQPLGAANDNRRSWPLIPFSPDWYVTCLGDRDLG